MQAPGIIRLLSYGLKILIACSLVMGLGLWHLHRWSLAPQALAEVTIIKVSPGISLADFASQLAAQQAIDSQSRFLFWIKSQRVFQKIQAGTYRFTESLSPQQLLDALLKGPNSQKILVNLTIPEGFNLAQTIEKLVELHIGSHDQLLQLSNDSRFIKGLGLESPSLEGFLYPATYYFYEEHPPAEEVFSTMVAEFHHRLPTGYKEQLARRNLRFYDAVVIASMIEKETSIAEERPYIAEVIWRRLKANIPLAIDATVIYGSNDYEGRLTYSQLKNRDNPYNTRVHRGLPPTPIASPTSASLAAVLSPSDQGFLYYVRLPGPEGKHHFAKTLQEHNFYVRKLIRAQSHRK